MSTRLYTIVLCVLGVSASGVYAADPSPTGEFVLPYDENQLWNACKSMGYVSPWDSGASTSHQYFMEWYDVLKKYHLAEDWNGKCGADTDLGAPLYAIADGIVQKTDLGSKAGEGNQIYIRYAFPYAKKASGVVMFDSVYMHLDSIDPSVVQGAHVLRRQTIAKLGKSGTTAAHLHWEAHWDNSVLGGNNAIPFGADPYKNPLNTAEALKYRAPSLIVDDRRSIKPIVLTTPNTWLTFKMDANAPSSTAYIGKGGVFKTLKQSMSAGWITAADLLHWDTTSNQWISVANFDDLFFQKDHSYAMLSRVSGATFYIPIPGNRFQEDRARLDMIHAVETNASFISVKTDTYTHDPNYSPEYEFHMMGFSGGAVAQATYKANPLGRYTSYCTGTNCTKTTGTWSPWKFVDWNQLY